MELALLSFFYFLIRWALPKYGVFVWDHVRMLASHKLALILNGDIDE